MPLLAATSQPRRPLPPPPGRAPTERCPRCGTTDWSRFGPRWLCRPCSKIGRDVAPDDEPRPARRAARGESRRGNFATRCPENAPPVPTAPAEKESPMSTAAAPPAPRQPWQLSDVERAEIALRHGTPQHWRDPSPNPLVRTTFWSYQPTADEIAAYDAKRDREAKIAAVN